MSSIIATEQEFRHVADATEATAEQGVAAALAELRRYAAAADRDDFHGEAAHEMLEQRPLIVLGVLTRGCTKVWAMEPGDDSDRSAALSTVVHHLGTERTEAGDVAHERVTTDVGQKPYLLAEIARLADWLNKEEAGLFLAQE